ncbi:MAG TPA: hypothetical protein PKV21_06600 [bacterium]|nr:hypothetical protein [bacterium]
MGENIKKFWFNGGAKLVIQYLVQLFIFLVMASFLLGSKNTEINLLKDKVNKLENCNQEILQRLSNIEGKLDILLKKNGGRK